MQFTPAGASAAHQKLGAGPPGRPVEAASAGGAPEHARVAQFAVPRPSGRASRAHELAGFYVDSLCSGTLSGHSAVQRSLWLLRAASVSP